MSEVKVNKISPRSGTTVTLGDSGDTITLASGVSLTGVNATFSGDLTVDTNTLYVDSTNNRVGIGTSSPDSILHLYSNNSGGTPQSRSALIIEDTEANGDSIQFLSTDTGFQSIFFGDASDNDVGRIAYSHTGDSMRFNTNASEAMRIDSSGNVGIGTTTTSSAKLNIQPNSGYLRVKEGRVDATNNVRLEAGGTVNTYLEYRGYLGHIWDVDNTERMRIDSSGNVLVGKTAIALATVGGELRADGQITGTKSGGSPLILNRTTSDGEIAQFYKDATKVGSIYNGGSNLGIDSSGGLLLVDDIITPTSGADNTKDIGRSSARWKDLYLGGNIYIGGTGSANALDDFEEGTWTPTLTFANSASGSLNYTQRQGIYTKVGRLVHIQVFVAWNANNFTASSGAFELQGLPFVNHNTSNYRGGASIVYASGAWSGLTIYQQALRAENTASKFRFNYSPNTNGVISTEVGSYTNIGSNGSFMISGTYQTN